ncbi:ankyrin repeat domain-containing protein 50-like [Ornithodoros turicata]|uniref:ankyrin repeat domain-containing protein 50-like n=1 Tax=Ornithodoros turicata TaxID=34597 RepID=UPI0031397B5B
MSLEAAPSGRRRFFCREWAFVKLSHCLDQRPSSKTCGALVVGGPGCGKTALCMELVWPTGPPGARQHVLGQRVLAHHFCQAHDTETLSVSGFVLSLVRQLSQSVAGYQDRLQDSDVAAALDRAALDPDDAFKKGVLFPLLELDPQPPQPCLLLVDSVDESLLVQVAPLNGSSQQPSPSVNGCSRTIAELLAAHHQLFPQWLMLVCSARKQSKMVTRMFTGFRKISLDDLRKASVVRDVQQYILCRLDREESLRQQLSRDTAEALNQLHIKSNGCFLYLERLLDGVAERSVTLREIRDIPGTLNGLYLWICQRLFARRQFPRLQPILNALLASRRPLTSQDLFLCLWTRDQTLTSEDFSRRLLLLSKVLVERDGYLLLFHHSFAEWLLDVKHCTQKYLCHASEGHAMLAMLYTVKGPDLTPVEMQDFAHHLQRVPTEGSLQSFHFPLWIISSQAPLERAFCPTVGSTAVPRDPGVLRLLVEAGAVLPGDSEEGQGDGDGDKIIGDKEGSLGRVEKVEEVPEDPLEALLASGGTVDDVDGNGRTLLHSSAYEGDLELVRRLLEKRAQLEVTDKNGQTPLNLAARQGHAEVVVTLLAAKANPDHADNDGWTPLRSSAWAGHLQVVDVLLDHGAQVDLADSEQRTALRAASWGGHEEIVSRLLAHGADVNRADREGRTALIAAAYMGHAEIVEHLLEQGAQVNHADADGRTALSVAALCVPASEGHAAVVALLLERNADVDHKDNEGMTPLLVAAFEGHKDVCELLLEGEADVDHTDNSSRTPLFAAASMGHGAVVSLLLFWGAYVDSIDGEGRTVLSIAAAQGSIEVVQHLLDRGLDELHRDNAGWTPLHYAALEGHAEVCTLLMDAGAKASELDNEGRTPLILASQEGHVDAVLSILKYSGHPPSLIDHKAHDGRTAFRVAALEGHKDTVHTLVSYNADVNYQDADGRSTLYLLALDGRTEMAEFILARGADPDATDPEGRTPLHVAAWQGHCNVVDLLLSRGARIDAQDHDQRTALQSASWQGHANVVRLLLERGAKVDHICVEGATALGIAAQEGHEAVVRTLLEYGADSTHVDQCGRTPARVAAKAGHGHVVKLLEEHAAMGRGSASTASLASASTAPCNAVLCPESPEGDKRRSIVSNRSDSKSSSNRTSSTTKSQPNVPPQQVDSSEGLSFTQQIQQCTRPRHRTSRVLSPLHSEPRSPGSPGAHSSPASEWKPANHLPPCGVQGRRGPLPELPGRAKRNGIVTNPNCKGSKNRENSSNQLKNLANYKDVIKSGSGIPVKKETPL